MSELKKIVERELKEFEEELKSRKIEKIVDILLKDSLGVRITASLVGGKWVIEEVEFTLTSGGPNIYLKVKDDGTACVDGWWGSEHYERCTYQLSKQLFEILADYLEEQLCMD